MEITGSFLRHAPATFSALTPKGMFYQAVLFWHFLVDRQPDARSWGTFFVAVCQAHQMSNEHRAQGKTALLWLLFLAWPWFKTFIHIQWISHLYPSISPCSLVFICESYPFLHGTVSEGCPHQVQPMPRMGGLGETIYEQLSKLAQEGPPWDGCTASRRQRS